MNNMFSTLESIKVELDNIRTFQGKSYEFYQGLNLIVGNNGSGKTTLVSSLYVGLYGRIPSSTLTLKRLITRGEKKGSIQVTMESDGNSLVVKREYAPSLSTTDILMNNVKLNSVDEVFDSEVMKLIYVNLLDKVDFTNYINLDWYYEKMKRYKDKISKDCVDTESEIKSIEMVVQTYYNQIQTKQQKLHQITEELRALESVIKALEDNLTSVDVDETLRKFNDLSYILSNFSIIKQKLLDDYRRSYTVKITELKQKISEIQSEYSVRAQEIQKFYTDKLNQVKNVYSISIASSNGSITNINTQINKLQNLLNIPNSTCPVCNSSIDVEHVQKEIQRLDLEKEKLLENVRELQKQLNEEVKAIQSEYTEKVTQLQEQYKPLISNLQSQVVELEKQVQIITVADDDVAIQYGYKSYSEMKTYYVQLQQTVSTIQTIKDKRSKSSFLVQQGSDIQDEIENLRTTIQKLRYRKNELEENLTNLLKVNEVFGRILDKKKMKQFILTRVADKINMITSVVNDLPIKVYAFVDDDKVSLMYRNSSGADVQFDELSSGEKVMATIISLFIYRKLLSSLNYNIPKIVVFDELLDRLDYSNAYSVLHFLSKLEDHIILIVTHREDIMQLSEEIQMNVIKLS